VPIPSSFVQEALQVRALQDRVEQALAALPGVTGVSATSSLPLTASADQNTIQIPGAPGNTGNRDQDSPLVDYMGIRARYAEVMGMRLIAGRSFETAPPAGVREALIDRTLAAQFFPTGTPIGTKIPWGRDEQKRERFLTIVGVVDQARLYDVHEDGRPQVYLRAEDFGYRNLSFVVRTTRDPESLAAEVQRVIRQIDGRIALTDVKTMAQIVEDSLRQQRMSAVLIAGFALGALILAAMGLFGIVSGFVTRRRRELAVRLALGADHQRLLRLVVTEGLLLVGIGVLIGVPGILVAGQLVRGVLVGISPTDPATLAAVSGGLAVVTLVTCYIPARRVLRIEPAQLLRQE
jgi:putative ABC transport system permease protein